MTDASGQSNFKLGTAGLVFALTSLLTWISFFFAFAKDEGQVESGAFLFNLVADSFTIFRLPLHAIFWGAIADNPYLYFITLFLNPIFWAVLIERLIHWARLLIRRNARDR